MFRFSYFSFTHRVGLDEMQYNYLVIIPLEDDFATSCQGYNIVMDEMGATTKW